MRDRDRERDRERQRETERERETQRETETERERECPSCLANLGRHETRDTMVVSF